MYTPVNGTTVPDLMVLKYCFMIIIINNNNVQRLSQSRRRLPIANTQICRHVCHRDDGTNVETTGKVQICKNNCMRRMLRVKNADKTRMGELRVEAGGRESVRKTLVRSRLKLASHLERLGGNDLTRR